MQKLLMLYATDLQEEILFVEPLLAGAFPQAAIQVANGARAALDYLTERLLRPDKETYPMPHLTLLDWDMPDSVTVLQWIRSQREISTMRVVLLGSTIDLAHARKLGAHDYIRKTYLNLHLTDRLRRWVHPGRYAQRRRRLRQRAFA